MNNIILTTTEPSAFGGAFDDEETRKECASRTKIIFNKYNDGNLPSNTNRMSVYYQGELEDVMGYDIPCLINGAMPELQYGDIIPVKAITLDDKSYDAVMLVKIASSMTGFNVSLAPAIAAVVIFCIKPSSFTAPFFISFNAVLKGRVSAS